MRVPERPLVSLQRNTKLYSCTQTVIRFFTAKYEILKLYPNGHTFVLQRNTQFSELYPNGHSFHQQRNKKFNYLFISLVLFLKTNFKKHEFEIFYIYLFVSCFDI